jgi:N-acetyl-gamma-glutamyl-phosphate reductase
VKVGIYGAAGYTGLELIKLINRHPEFQTEFATSEEFAGQSYEGVTFCPREEADPARTELVFLCTPHGASAPLAKAVLDAGAKVVDLSADLRLRTPEAYQQWYNHPHPVPELLPTVYGLTEFYRDDIKGEFRVANPGCYVTTALLALLPLAKSGAIKAGTSIIVDAKSGVSGAGRKPSMGTLFGEVYGDFKPYNIGRTHRHTGEIEQELCAAAPNLGPLVFSPHLLPIDRGLLATCYVQLDEGWNMDWTRKLFNEFYEDEPLITVLPDGGMARIADVARTPNTEISLHEATPGMLIIVSALDNLLKGASSQAMQNANVMFGMPETAGLL